MNSMLRRSFPALAALGLAAAVAPAPGAAQLVPKLVDYPARVATAAPQAACTLDSKTGLAIRRSGSTTVVFASRDCSADTLLFTVALAANDDRTILPTSLGVATLAQRCAQFPWSAGTPQQVTAGSCDVP